MAMPSLRNGRECCLAFLEYKLAVTSIMKAMKLFLAGLVWTLFQACLAMGWSGDVVATNDNPGASSAFQPSRPSNVDGTSPAFHVLAFQPRDTETAHWSFIEEANRWFARAARENKFTYEATTNWNRLNPVVLSNIQVVVFLNQRPENTEQRRAFEAYMSRGGGWMGFHFAAFALTPSAVPQNWDWYHQEFLGSGSYTGNTWRPTPAVLRVEQTNHPALKGIPGTFKAPANEWYKWSNDLRHNPDIRVLLSIDSSSFPLGTGPKPHEIWHEGDYPVVWANIRYRMIYCNLGHNDIDFDSKTLKKLSHTMDNPEMSRLILNSLLWLGKGN
jgi:hypothetical protein